MSKPRCNITDEKQDNENKILMFLKTGDPPVIGSHQPRSPETFSCSDQGCRCHSISVRSLTDFKNDLINKQRGTQI